jgi:hypothetical protein
MLIIISQLLRLCKDFSTEVNANEGVARLSIGRVYPEDEGEYTCVAYNELGSDSTSACLIVDGNLIFTPAVNKNKKTGQKRPFVLFSLQSVQLFQHFYYYCCNPPPLEITTVADDKENDLMVQLDSRPAGTVSARATPRTTPSRTIRSLSPINSSKKNLILISNQFETKAIVSFLG